MRRPVSVFGGLVACVMVVAGALVLRSENPPPVTKLPAGSQVFGYQLAADGQGAATIAWSTSDFVSDSAASIIRVSEQNSEGKWSRAVEVGGANQSLNPLLAESQAGAAVIVWSYVRGGQTDRTLVVAATRSSPSSAWSTPRTIWSISGVDGARVTTGIDSGGDATVVWARYGPSANPAIWTANIDTKNARVTRPQKLIRAGAGGTDLTLAVNSAGAALLSWQHELHLTKHGNTLLPTVHAAEMVSYRQVSGTWLAPHRLSTFAYQEEPQGMNIWAPASLPSVVTTDGTAAIAWLAGASGSSPVEISARDPSTGSWFATSKLSGAGAFDDSVADGPRESLLALWSSTNDRGLLRTATAASADGVRWSSARELPSPRNGFAPFLASDPKGDQAIAIAGPGSRILYTTRTGSDSWSAPRLAGRGFNPEAATSNNGSITLAWEHGQPPHNVIETRTYH
jgi:hypothetical protein